MVTKIVNWLRVEQQVIDRTWRLYVWKLWRLLRGSEIEWKWSESKWKKSWEKFHHSLCNYFLIVFIVVSLVLLFFLFLYRNQNYKRFFYLQRISRRKTKIEEIWGMTHWHYIGYRVKTKCFKSCKRISVRVRHLYSIYPCILTVIVDLK